MVHINSDKLQHDKPSNDKTALFLLHPFRALFVSMPGGGKRQACLELIGRHPKPFGTITVMHLDPKGTTEYELLGDAAKMIGEDELPDASTFDHPTGRRGICSSSTRSIYLAKSPRTRRSSTGFSTTAPRIVRLAPFAKSKMLSPCLCHAGAP